MKASRLFLIILFLLILTKTIQFVRVDGLSMAPTFDNGDLLFTVKDFNPKVGDVVTIWSPELKTNIVKRITGVPGDTVEYVLDGVKGTAVVEEGKYFVEGDNYLDSYDSRYEEIGQISRENINNKVLYDLSYMNFVDYILLAVAVINPIIFINFVNMLKASEHSEKEVMP